MNGTPWRTCPRLAADALRAVYEPGSTWLRAGRAEVDVFCPGFVSDCLETLEEIGIAAKARFLEAGGRELNVIPCLNEAPEWIEALRRISRASG